jgi:hypothetical protein
MEVRFTWKCRFKDSSASTIRNYIYSDEASAVKVKQHMRFPAESRPFLWSVCISSAIKEIDEIEKSNLVSGLLAWIGGSGKAEDVATRVFEKEDMKEAYLNCLKYAFGELIPDTVCTFICFFFLPFLTHVCTSFILCRALDL